VSFEDGWEVASGEEPGLLLSLLPLLDGPEKAAAYDKEHVKLRDEADVGVKFRRNNTHRWSRR
jgi:hypothetical protein